MTKFSIAETSSAPTLEDIRSVTESLGREPRGLAAIAVRSHCGRPVVIQVASLVERKPFPTLFWLVDKILNYEIDKLEAAGFIARFQQSIDRSSTLQQQLLEDHRAHIALRNRLMTVEQRRLIEQLGFADLFRQRGIGGIQDFGRIRCLHTHYAAHLVVPNTVGRLVDEHWQANSPDQDS